MNFLSLKKSPAVHRNDTGGAEKDPAAGFTSQTFLAPLLSHFCTQTPAFMTWQRFCKHVPSSDLPAHTFSAINTINNILQNASPAALRQSAAVRVHESDLMPGPASLLTHLIKMGLIVL